MATLTLEELKAQNKAEEEAALKAAEDPEVEEEEGETPASEDQEEENQDESEESGTETGEEEEGADTGSEEGSDDDETKGEDKPDWMKAEDDEPDAKYTDSDAAAIRRKWKGKAEKERAENEALTKKLEEMSKEIETLRSSRPSDLPKAKAKPNRDDFPDDDQYLEALADYKIELKQQEAQSAQISQHKKQAQADRQEQIAKATDAHYTRAAKLAEKSGITPEAYQSADTKIRKAVDTVFPEGGDAITDALISITGEGSEKVFYHLGVNTAKREAFTQMLKEDPSGMKAAAYLGKLNAELSVPAKRESKAPPPSKQIQGDGGKPTGAKALLQKYKDAHKKGSAQDAFNIKKKAKEQGVDTSSW